MAAAAGADVIFVLQRGRVVERGTHAGLLDLGGVYAGLWRKQDGLSLSADGSAAHVSREGPGGPVELAILEDGEQFGEQALLSDAPRNATVTVKTDCLFLTLSRAHFLELLGGSPEARRRIDAAAELRRVRDSRAP